MASQQDWIPDVLRQEARQQLKRAFGIYPNPFPESADEIETKVFSETQNSKEGYTALMRNVMKSVKCQRPLAQKAQIQQQQQGMGLHKGMMRTMQPTQSVGMQQQQMPAPQMLPVDDEASLQESLHDDILHSSKQEERSTSISDQPQLTMPDGSYLSSPDGSVGSTHNSSLSSAHPSNSPQVSAMSPALRTPGSVSVDHSPAVDDEASLQESLHDDIPHSSKQEGRSTSSFDQTIARLNRKRKHRTPSPTNPQDPTSSVELNDAQDPADPFLKKVENFVNDLETNYKFWFKCGEGLRKMIDREEDEREKQEMQTVLEEVGRFRWRTAAGGRLLLQNNMWTNQITEDFCKTQLRIWISNGKYPPPPVYGVEFIKKDGKLVVIWKSASWPFAPRYCGECVESSGKKRHVENFENIAETSYELSKVSPICGYVVTVWAVDQKGQRGEEGMSERGILCTKHGDIYVDDTSPLRPNYEVYKGYLNSTSSTLDKVAVKIVQAKTSREVEALQALKHKNIVTYRLSKYYVDRFNKGWMCVAMELCSTDTFQELVVDNKLNMDSCKLSLLHMMLGLAAIHEEGFLHRDLKPQNILRSLGKDGKAGKDMKVADFGLCKEMDPNKSRVTKSVLEVGTEGWGSPEHYEPGAKMSAKSDIYSGGLVAAFGLSCGKHVYGSDPDYWKLSIKRGFEMDLSILACDNAEIAKDMISKMLQRDPDNRPTAKQVLAHPFFWDDDKILNFLHQMHLFFAPAISDLKKKVAPQQQTMTVMQHLDTKKSIFKTKQGEANWVKKMEETPGVCSSYEHVLLTAKGLVPPKTKYDHTSVVHLIRFIRNVATHYREKKEFLKEFNDNRSNVWKLFYKCFPTLFCTVYNAVYKHFPQIENCRDFPNDVTRFFTEPAHYQPLP